MSEQEKNTEQGVHKRRARYKGKYPRKFEEKYKELQPEKYQDTIAHVIQKGNTPAGMHISIMVQEILDFLKIQPGEVGFDATLGYGGHTKAMLQCLEGKGHIYATDVDPEESAKTKKRLEVLNKSNDGFFIASEDLKLRGPGDLFGIRQSGILEFKMGDVFQDAKVLEQASEAAELERPEYERLKERLKGYMSRSAESISL